MDSQEPDIRPTPPSDTNNPVDDTPKKVWFKDKRLLLVCVGVVVVAASTLAYLGLFRDSTPPASSSTPESTENSSTVQRTQTDRYVSEGYSGLSFKAPSGWSLVRQDQGSVDYRLYSPDAVEGYGAFGGVSEGISITLKVADRDTALEAKKEQPLEAYIPQSNPDAGNQGEPNYFKNKHGVEMAGYAYSYEGCFMRVIFVGGQSLYLAEIQTGGGCPDDSILANADIKTFIDSVELAGSSVESDIYISSGGSKGVETYKVYAGALEFEYTRFSDDQSALALLESTVVPKLKSDGTFERLITSATAAQLASGHDCEGCGFTLQAYDSGIVFTTTKPSIEGFTKLAENIYGKEESTQPIQQDASATKYTYIKTFDGGSFTVTSTVEQHSSDDTKHSLTLSAFIKTLESLRTL